MVDPQKIIDALIANGHYEAAELAREVVQIEREATRAEALALPPYFTGRMWDVLRLTVAGYTNQEIAQQLFLSLRTVRRAQADIMKRLNVRTRAAVISIVQIKGWFADEQDAPGAGARP